MMLSASARADRNGVRDGAPSADMFLLVLVFDE
jgi:hypothetical protein